MAFFLKKPNNKDILNSYYLTTTHANTLGNELFAEQLICDVCIVGGGLVGLSTAIELADLGVSVILLESSFIGNSSSGLSGGQVVPGYACDMRRVEKIVGPNDARVLWNLSLNAVRKIESRIVKNKISCEWAVGTCQVASRPEHVEQLQKWYVDAKDKYNYHELELWSKEDIRMKISGSKYHAGLYDRISGHINPLKYLLGLVCIAKQKGVKIFEHAMVQSIQGGVRTRAITKYGSVASDYLVLACGFANKRFLPKWPEKIIPVNAYMIATERLPTELAKSLISNNMAVYDTNRVQNYFHLTSDNRIVFGGDVSYFKSNLKCTAESLNKKLISIFPQLQSVKIEYSWSGLCDNTVNRMPEFGKIQKNIFYIQGLNGLGIGVSLIAAEAIAEEVSATSHGNSFELFRKINHQNIKYGLAVQSLKRQVRLAYYNFLDKR